MWHAFTPLPSTIENDGDDGNFSGNEFYRTSFKLKKEKKLWPDVHFP